MKSITIPAETKNLDSVVAFVLDELRPFHCSRKTLFQIRLAIEEIYINIVSYAYHPETGLADIRCEVLQEPLRVVIQFLDGGVPFDPLAREDADLSPEAIEEREGGLGIFLVKQTMDDVQYSYENGKNILTIQKNL